MIEIFKDKINTKITWTIAFSLLLTAFAGCKAPAKFLTVGIINDVEAHSTILDGFKIGMTELGYTEGENIKYIYNGVIESKDVIIDAEIKKLLVQDIDLLFTSGTATISRAKVLLEGSDIPIITAAGGELVETGIVKSLTHPGGNITGVQLVDTASKGLEWLPKIIPGLKKVYVPYNPDEMGTAFYIDILKKDASQMGIDLELHEVHSIEDILADIETISGDVNAIFRLPSPSIDPRSGELSQAAIRKGIPMGTAMFLDEDVLFALTSDYLDTGKKAARLADQIHHGMKPADLPIEIPDVFLTINLKTAEKIGINIPDNVLIQSKNIIR